MTRTSLQEFKADFFRALAHPLRIRLLETLGSGERTVQELQHALAVEQPVVSQQLAVLRAKQIVIARKTGHAVQSALADPLITRLLAVARDIFNNHLAESQTLLRELQRERRR
jgi:DNA-binding transcriptional ArsR family regulator